VGIFYFILFVYTIDTQIAYILFPDLSIVKKFYYGYEVFSQYYYFVLASFLFFYLLFKVFWPRLLKSCQLKVITVRNKYLLSLLAYVILIVHPVLITCGALYYLPYLDYNVIQEKEVTKSLGAIFEFFILACRIGCPFFVVLYMTYRYRDKIKCLINRRFHIFSLIIYGVVLVLFSVLSGSRNILSYLFICVLVFELIYIRDETKNIKRRGVYYLKILSFIAFMLIFFNYIRMVRAPGVGFEYLAWYEKIIMDDYLAPSLVLFNVIANNFIDFSAVALSNFYNSLIKMNYPLLQELVLNKTSTFNVTRTQSPAFYILTEGYIALGMYGFLYNGITLIVGLFFWRILSLTNNYIYNMFMVTLTSGLLIHIVRGQSFYFFKFFYLNIVFGLLMIFVLTGVIVDIFSFSLKKRKRKWYNNFRQ